MIRVAIIFSLALLTGCTVISNNRVFPKLAPFWTHEAAQQRESNRRHEADMKAYQEQQRWHAITNGMPLDATP